MTVGSRQLRCLLTILLVRAGRPTSITELVELLWGENSPPSAVNVVHKYVGLLRRLLEPGLPPRQPGRYVARSGNWYCLPAGPAMLDLARSRQHVAAAKKHAGHGELDDALDRYESAWDLWRGPVGEGLADTSAAEATFSAVDHEMVEAVVAGAVFAVRSRRASSALGPLRRAAEIDPFNEMVQASLISTLAAAGSHAAALGSYRAFRSRLADELGIRPGPDLENAHRRVLNQTALTLARTTSPQDAPASTDAIAGEIVALCTRLQVALDVLATHLAEVGDRRGGPALGLR